MAICSCLAEIYSRTKSTELSISSTLIFIKSSPDGRDCFLEDRDRAFRLFGKDF